MKCPCCSSDTDLDFIVVHNTIHKSDGTRIKCTPTPLRLFSLMLEGKPVMRTTRKQMYNLDSHIGKLRTYIKTAGLPYTVVFENDRYVLRINRS